jgi:inner membrane protein
MPTIITHSIVSGLLGKAIKWKPTPLITGCSVLCGSLPDVDVVGRFFGIEYLHEWGHRGMSHSFFIAACIGLCLSFLCSDRSVINRVGWWLYFTLLTSTHTLLDMFTNGGHGVAIFAPWSHQRHFAPDSYRVVEVSPLNFRFFTWERLSPVFYSELMWIILPIFFLVLIRWLIEVRFNRV